MKENKAKVNEIGEKVRGKCEGASSNPALSPTLPLPLNYYLLIYKYNSNLIIRYIDVLIRYNS